VSVFRGDDHAGASAIFGLRMLEVEPKYVIAFPCVILTAYLVYILRTERYGLALDRGADNLYYMGLLFTLVSVSYSLWVARRLTREEAVLEIISGFGVALLATILGMAYRVVAMQFRHSPEDTEREARAALAEATQALRDELSALSRDVSVSREAFIQSLTLSQKHAEKHIVASADDVGGETQRCAKAIGKMASRLEHLSESLEGRGGRVVESADLLAGSIARTAEELEKHTSQVREAGETVRAVEARMKEESEKRTASEQAANQALSEMGALVRDLGIRELRDALIDTVGTLKDGVTELEAIEAKFEGLGNAIGVGAQRVSGGVEKYMESLNGLTDALSRREEEARELVGTAEELAAQARKLVDAGAMQQQQLATVFREFHRAPDALTSVIEKIEQRGEVHERQISKTVGAITRLGNELPHEQVAAVKGGLEDLVSSLVEAREIKETLQQAAGELTHAIQDSQTELARYAGQLETFHREITEHVRLSGDMTEDVHKALVEAVQKFRAELERV